MNCLTAELKSGKFKYFLFGLQITFVLFSFVYFLIIDQLRNSFMSLFTLLLIPAYLSVEKLLKIEFGYGFLVLLLLLTLGGIVLGPGYDLYMYIPIFDDILHLVAGFLFCCGGFVISKRIIKDERFGVHIFVGVLFSLAVAVLWEMIEYSGTVLAGIDMQEDSIVTSFKSFYLANSHNDIVVVDNIKQTVIQYGDNESIVIDGYLDLGVYDTLNDMLACVLGTIAYLITMIFGKNGSFGKLFCIRKQL